MEINYLGRSCFKVVGKKISVLIDPFVSSSTGIKIGKQDADVVITTHNHLDHNNLSLVKSEDYLHLDSPGEYEVKDSEFVGVSAFHDEQEGAERGKVTMFSFEVDGVKVAHLGDLGTELTSPQLDCLDGVDILMIPVGGFYTIDAKKAVKVITQIEPKVVIPMHYKGSHSGEISENLAPVADFLHEMGINPEPIDKYKIVKKELPAELQVVVLKY